MSAKIGQVVYLHHGQDLRPARVIGGSAVVLEVEQSGGHRSTHGLARFAHLSEHTVASGEALVAWEALVHELMAGIDVPTLWEAVAGANHSLGELAAIAGPAPGPAADDATFWALTRNQAYFRRVEGGQYVPRPREEVYAARAAEQEKRERAELADAVTAWLRGEPASPEQVTRFVKALEPLVIYDDDRAECEVGRAALRRLGPKSPEGDGPALFRRLVDLGVFTPDENLPLRRSGLPTVFTPEVLANAESLAADTDTLARRDLRELLTVAIDDPHTTEIDDAFAWTESPRRLYVCIADPSALIPEGSPVDLEARRRAATLYLPEGKVPMLPERLCDDRASLVAGQDRPAMAFVFEIGPTWRIEGFSIEDVLIRVDCALTYRDVDAILRGAKEHVAGALLVSLAAASERQRQDRIENGAMPIDRRDISIHCTDDGKVEVLAYRTDDASRRLVAEWMIQASSHAGQLCSERRAPAVYRRQSPPDERPHIPTGRALQGHEIHSILKTLHKAELSTTPDSHAGLGLAAYTQVTSPLRRYQDLLMHRQLRHVLRRGVARYSADELIGHFSTLEAQAASHREVERESRRYWQLRHLEGRVGQRVKCEVLRSAGKRLVVELVDFGVQALYQPTGKTPALGDMVVLLLKSADARRDRITLV